MYNYICIYKKSTINNVYIKYYIKNKDKRCIKYNIVLLFQYLQINQHAFTYSKHLKNNNMEINHILRTINSWN